MTLHLHSDAREFAALAGTHLLEHEAENNLMLGILSRLLTLWPQRGFPGAPAAVLATIADAGMVIGAAVMTPPHRLLLSVMPEAAASELASELLHAGIRMSGVNGPVAPVAAFAACCQQHLRTPVHAGRRLHIHRLRQVREPRAVQGSLRAATALDQVTLQAWWEQFASETASPGGEPLAGAIAEGRVWLWTLGSGQAVSTVSWTGRTAHGVRLVQVYTPERFRHQGYASAGVAALSRMLLAGGREFCFLYTDDDTPHLAELYAAIGYEPVCSCQEWDFEAAAIASE